MHFTLPPLPYSSDALSPYISKQTMEIHHQKHHGTYIENLNKLITGTKYASMSLEEIIIKSKKDKNLPVFNNAGQNYNHTVFWLSMKPGGGGKPGGSLLRIIEQDFGSFDAFLESFKKLAKTKFGSGWAWLSFDKKNGKLVLDSTSDAENPLTEGMLPLITIDIWEHAYYLDYQNKRIDYVDNFFTHIVNWDFAQKSLTEHLAKTDKTH